MGKDIEQLVFLEAEKKNSAAIKVQLRFTTIPKINGHYEKEFYLLFIWRLLLLSSLLLFWHKQKFIIIINEIFRKQRAVIRTIGHHQRHQRQLNNMYKKERKKNEQTVTNACMRCVFQKVFNKIYVTHFWGHLRGDMIITNTYLLTSLLRMRCMRLQANTIWMERKFKYSFMHYAAQSAWAAE